ncbi:transposase [Streptomyces mirabilis]
MPDPLWLEGRGGQPEGYRHRQMLDAVRYLTDNGTKRVAGLLAELHDRLRGLVREDAGRDPEPTATVIDAQSLRTAPTIPRSTSGWDGGKKVGGRKRHVVVDCLGLLLVVMVTAAGAVRHAGAPSIPRAGCLPSGRPAGPGPPSRDSLVQQAPVPPASPQRPNRLIATTGSRGRVPASAGKPEATHPGGAIATPCRQ